MAILAATRQEFPDADEPVVDPSEDAKPAFLARLSHELRTPMAGIVGTIELLGREPLTEYQRQLLKTVLLSAEELLGVVNAVLDGPMPAPADAVPCVPIPLGGKQDEGREDALDTVLVVDDSELNLEVLCQQLRTLGMSADTASDGLQGLAKWRRRRYALVIADIQMPRMDGLEMTRQIRAEEARSGNGQAIPIIALSANAQRGGDEAAMAAGFNGYLTKPLMLRRLQETLNQWIDKDAPEQEAPRQSSSIGPIDRQALTDMVGGNTDVVESVLQRFAIAGALLVKEIGEAAQDSDKLKRLAHKLKGTARSVSAQRLGDLAEKLESSRSAADITALEQEWRRVAGTLDRWRADMAA